LNVFKKFFDFRANWQIGVLHRIVGAGHGFIFFVIVFLRLVLLGRGLLLLLREFGGRLRFLGFNRNVVFFFTVDFF
jgi:hypothetical protein